MYLGGPHAQAVTEADDFFDLGRPQVKFWASLEARASPQSWRQAREYLERDIGTGTLHSRASQVAEARRALEEATGPVHPGVRWLVLLDDSGLTQGEAARQMGVSPMTLSRYVNGQGIPTARVVVEFARVVGADVRVLWQEVADYELAVALEAPLQG